MMRFTVVGSAIVCSRKDNTAEDDDVYRRVVEFDAHVETVPPHVAARLTTAEIERLSDFMADRKRIQANPAVKNMLEVLPGLLQEATDILDAADSINKTMYRKLSASIEKLRGALDNVQPISRQGPTQMKEMHHSEAQRERLENIKQ